MVLKNFIAVVGICLLHCLSAVVSEDHAVPPFAFNPESLAKPVRMKCMAWIDALESQRNKADCLGNFKAFKLFTKEISATIGGKYGISKRKATKHEQAALLYSITRTRHKFCGKRNMLSDFCGVGEASGLESHVQNHLAAVLAIDTMATKAMDDEGFSNQWAAVKPITPATANFIALVNEHAKTHEKPSLVANLQAPLDKFLTTNHATIALANEVFNNFAPMSKEAFTDALTMGMNAVDKSYVSISVTKIPPQHHDSFVSTVNALAVGMDETLKRYVIESVAKVAPEHYALFITTVNALTIWIRDGGKSSIISSVATVAPQHYNSFVATVNAVKEIWGPYRDDSSIISSVATVAPQHYNSFVATFNALTIRMRDGKNKYSIISSVATVAPEHYDSFVATANALTGWIRDEDKSSIISSVATVAPQHYDSFVATANALTIGIRDGNKSSIISSIATVSPQHYNSFVAAVTALKKIWGLGRDISPMISSVAKVTPQHYNSFVGKITVMNKMIGNLLTDSWISSVANRIDPKDYLKSARALLFIRWLEEGVARNRRIFQILEADLKLNVPAVDEEVVVGNLRAMAQAGVNVHAAERDNATNQAYLRLFSLWEPTAQEEVEEYSNALIAYAKNKDLNAVNRVLYGTDRTGGGFGGLLQGNGLYINVNQILPAETILAHLWHFITHDVAEHISPSEVELAKASLVAAVHDAIERDGHVVCDPGKLQRIATAVLQGRLQGVKIDQKIPMPTNSAIVPVTDPSFADLPAEAAIGAAPAQRRYIRDKATIRAHLAELLRHWQDARPANANDLFAQSFAYLQELNQLEIFLDPRDVVFYLIFGEATNSKGNAKLDPSFSMAGSVEGMFLVNDYIAQYLGAEQRSQEANRNVERKQNAQRITTQPSGLGAAPSSGC